MSCRPWGGRFLMQTAHLQLQSSRRRIARLLASIAVERARCINRPHSGATVLQSLHNRVKTTACKPWNQRPCQQRDRTRSCSPPSAPWIRRRDALNEILDSTGFRPSFYQLCRLCRSNRGYESTRKIKSCAIRLFSFLIFFFLFSRTSRSSFFRDFSDRNLSNLRLAFWMDDKSGFDSFESKEFEKIKLLKKKKILRDIRNKFTYNEENGICSS